MVDSNVGSGPLAVTWEWAARGLPAEAAALIEAVTSWVQPPTAWCGGRSGWEPVGTGTLGPDPSRAFKLKGLGLAPSPETSAAPPAAVPYDRWPGQEPDPHLGIRSDGELVLVPGASSPLGGLTLAGAHREVRCAAALHAAGVPAVTPVAVLRYDALSFASEGGVEPLGVSVTGSPIASVARVDVALPGLSGESDAGEHLELKRLAAVLCVGGDPRSQESRLALLAAAYRRLGGTLRAFSAAGWYRYSGHPGNFVVGDDGRAVLVDLDSSQPLGALDPAIAALQEVRDGMSGLYNLVCSFFVPSVVTAITDRALVDHEPFSAFLDGWDPGSAGTNDAVGAAIARYVVRSREQLRRFGEFLASPTDAGPQLYRHVRHDRDLTFIWLFRIAALRRLARPGRWSNLPHRAELDARLLRFGGRDRFDRTMALELET